VRGETSLLVIPNEVEESLCVGCQREGFRPSLGIDVLWVSLPTREWKLSRRDYSTFESACSDDRVCFSKL